MKEPQTEEERRRAIAWAVALTADTPLAPDAYEGTLLERYARGEFTLSQVLTQLDTRVHHLLYRSRATYPLSEPQLTALVEQAQGYNEAHDITGLLCYTDAGHFVQVLEGSENEVHALFAKIKQDQRHGQVEALSDYATSTRWFADWRMAVVHTDPHEFHWLLGYLEAKGHNLVKPQIPIISSALITLLEEFSRV